MEVILQMDINNKMLINYEELEKLLARDFSSILIMTKNKASRFSKINICTQEAFKKYINIEHSYWSHDANPGFKEIIVAVKAAEASQQTLPGFIK